MFIRIKKVRKNNGKSYEYAHLVMGVWKKKKCVFIGGVRKLKKYNNSVHKYKAFLGRVYRFEERFDKLDSLKVSDFEDLEIKQIYKKLIGLELLASGFLEINGVFSKDNCFVDLNHLLVLKDMKPVVLKLSKRGGYLCNYTLKELFKIKFILNRGGGLNLMKRLNNVGIKVGADFFFFLVSKLLNEHNRISV